MQASLQRMKNNIRAEKQACVRVYEIYIIVCLLIIPLVAFTSDGALYMNEGAYFFKYSALTPIAYIMLAVMTLILCIRLFREMQSSTQADVILSLPMSAKERYFSKVLTLARLILLPYLITAVISSIAAIIADKTLFEHSGLTLIYYIRGLSVFFLGGLCVIMYTAAVCFICCSFCSKTATAAASSVFMAAAWALVVFAMLNKLLPSCAGLSFQNSYTERFIFAIEPIFYIFVDELGELDLGRWCFGTAVNILISTGALLLGFHVYKKRDKSSLTYNTAAKPFMLIVIAVVGMAAILYEIFGTVSYMPYAVLVTGLLIYTALLWRGGFKIKKCIGWLIGYAGVITGFMAFLALAYYTNGLGLARHSIYYREGGSYQVSAERHYYEYDERNIPLQEIDTVDALGLDAKTAEEMIADIEKYTFDDKCFEAFCEFVGLRSKTGSEYYDFELMEHSGDSSDDYIGSQYVRQSDSCNHLTVSMLPCFPEDSQLQHDSDYYKKQRKNELYEAAESISISLFITPEKYEELKRYLTSRYGAQATEELIEYYEYSDDEEYDQEENLPDTEEE